MIPIHIKISIFIIASISLCYILTFLNTSNHLKYETTTLDANGHKRGNVRVFHPNHIKTYTAPDEQVHNEITIDEKSEPKHMERPGFIVLGMHRSGTSMLSGLMVQGLGYKVGDPLIGGHYDNPKGFFELLPIVLQNDKFLAKQRASWATNVINFDNNKAVEHKRTNQVNFKEGERGLAFLNDPNKSPWLQKDPRMCITLGVWLELMDREPAVLFTYRHPLEVANSLEKRQESVPFYQGLRLWIVYNIRAVQNSAHLCRVLSSNEAVLANPLQEVQRISDELTSKCGVPAPPKKLQQSIIDRFLDPNLQHKKGGGIIESEILATHGDCIVYDFDRDHGSRQQFQTDLYLKAMKMYCDFKSGAAYEAGYEWPELQ